MKSRARRGRSFILKKNLTAFKSAIIASLSSHDYHASGKDFSLSFFHVIFNWFCFYPPCLPVKYRLFLVQKKSVVAQCVCSSLSLSLSPFFLFPRVDVVYFFYCLFYLLVFLLSIVSHGFQRILESPTN